jgi:hypothetical protein
MSDHDKKRSGKDRLEDVPWWVRGDPELLADWLATDWDADLEGYRAAGGRENQAVTGRRNAPKTKK